MLLIPDEVLLQANISEAELRQEIAVLLYKESKLSLGRAMKLAQLNHFEFQKLLNERGVDLNYGVQEFNEDLRTLRELKMI